MVLQWFPGLFFFLLHLNLTLPLIPLISYVTTNKLIQLPTQHSVSPSLGVLFLFFVVILTRYPFFFSCMSSTKCFRYSTLLVESSRIFSCSEQASLTGHNTGELVIKSFQLTIIFTPLILKEKLQNN